MSDNVDKSRKFVELAEKRVNAAIKSIKSIGNLANKRNYVYDDAQVKKIIRALRGTVKEIETAFLTPERKKSTGFKL
jgi:hypothetical protein